jgi:hypothetical protein
VSADRWTWVRLCRRSRTHELTGRSIHTGSPIEGALIPALMAKNQHMHDKKPKDNTSTSWDLEPVRTACIASVLRQQQNNQRHMQYIRCGRASSMQNPSNTECMPFDLWRQTSTTNFECMCNARFRLHTDHRSRLCARPTELILERTGHTLLARFASIYRRKCALRDRRQLVVPEWDERHKLNAARNSDACAYHWARVRLHGLLARQIRQA